MELFHLILRIASSPVMMYCRFCLKRILLPRVHYTTVIVSKQSIEHCMFTRVIQLANEPPSPEDSSRACEQNKFRLGRQVTEEFSSFLQDVEYFSSHPAKMTCQQSWNGKNLNDQFSSSPINPRTRSGVPPLCPVINSLL